MKEVSMKPSKLIWLTGMVMGGLFIIYGISFFLFIPSSWPAVAAGIFAAMVITAVSAENFFNAGSISAYTLTLELGDNLEDDFEERLKKLQSLRDDSLITEKEYLIKRNELMDEK